MSTKLFVLKLQSSESTTPPKDYILVLNRQLTPDEFANDLRELYPAIPKTNGRLGLVLEGSYSMTPRQFLRYMVTAVAYMPEVEGGVCVPKLLGKGNGIKVVYGEGLELAQHIPRRQSAAPVLSQTTPERIPASSNIGKLVKEFDAIKVSQNLEPSASCSERMKSNKAQDQSHHPCPGPTHENAKHVLVIYLSQERSILPTVSFSSIRLEDVSQSGSSQELESVVLARLPAWLDLSLVTLKFSRSLFGATSPHVTWNKDSFCWCEESKYWMLSITATISW